jgi:ornithine cyclodeaminase/alanine dehydrogenase-like protein (mu-crystallin family)
VASFPVRAGHRLAQPLLCRDRRRRGGRRARPRRRARCRRAEASRLTDPEPLLRTGSVKPGAFVVPYGTVSAVELDLLDVMDKVVVDDWREAQSGRFGALRRHVDTGRLTATSLYAELGQIVAGQLPGRERSDERILFWHRGLAILDIAVGLAILRRAEQQDAGTMLRYR